MLVLCYALTTGFFLNSFIISRLKINCFLPWHFLWIVVTKLFLFRFQLQVSWSTSWSSGKSASTLEIGNLWKPIRLIFSNFKYFYLPELKMMQSPQRYWPRCKGATLKVKISPTICLNFYEKCAQSQQQFIGGNSTANWSQLLNFSSTAQTKEHSPACGRSPWAPRRMLI